MTTKNMFLRYLTAEKGMAVSTVQAYRESLSRLEMWRGDPDVRIRDLSTKDLAEFVSNLNYDGLKPATVRRIFAGVRAYFRFLFAEGVITSDPSAQVDLPELESKVPRFLSKTEVDRLLQQPDLTTELGVRDRAILNVLYASGLRVSEAAGMNVGDLDSLRRVVTVLGKGSKPRIVPCNQQSVDSVAAYLSLRDDAGQNDPLFLDDEFSDRITRHRIWSLVKTYADAAGLDNVSPHTLRHTFATHLMQSGKTNIRFVQQMLGHAKLATTQIYTHIVPGELREHYHEFHPRAS